MSLLKWMDYVFTGSSSGLSDEQVLVDPYTHYARIRARGRVLRSLQNRGWMVLGYEEVQTVLTDNRLSADLRIILNLLSRSLVTTPLLRGSMTWRKAPE